MILRATSTPDAAAICQHHPRLGRHPYSMMLGLDSTFDGVVFTGYHNAAGTDSNPLSHTMVTNVVEFRIGELASELHMNSLTAAREGVPVYAVTGDDGICAWMKEKSPNTVVVPVNFGMGGCLPVACIQRKLLSAFRKLSNRPCNSRVKAACSQCLNTFT